MSSRYNRDKDRDRDRDRNSRSSSSYDNDRRNSPPHSNSNSDGYNQNQSYRRDYGQKTYTINAKKMAEYYDMKEKLKADDEKKKEEELGKKIHDRVITALVEKGFNIANVVNTPIEKPVTVSLPPANPIIPPQSLQQYVTINDLLGLKKQLDAMDMSIARMQDMYAKSLTPHGRKRIATKNWDDSEDDYEPTTPSKSARKALPDRTPRKATPTAKVLTMSEDDNDVAPVSEEEVNDDLDQKVTDLDQKIGNKKGCVKKLKEYCSKYGIKVKSGTIDEEYRKELLYKIVEKMNE